MRDLEAIVVDNASSDGSVDLVREHYPSVDLITFKSNAGFAAATNAGIARAKGDYIAVLNNDAVPHRDWAASLVDYMCSNEAVGFCASRVVFYMTPSLVDSCGDYYAREGVAGKIGHLAPADRFEQPEEVFGAAASAAIYRRELLEEVGGFDEDFYLVHEDTDLSFRARLMGYTCHFVPSAIVRHHVSRTIGYRSPLAEYYASRNQEFVFLKDMPGALLLRYLAFHVLANGLQFAAHATRGRAGAWLRGKRDAMRFVPELIRKRRLVQRAARASPDAIDRILTRGWFVDAIRRLNAGRRAAPLECDR